MTRKTTYSCCLILIMIWCMLLSPSLLISVYADSPSPILRQSVFVMKKGQRAQAALTEEAEGNWYSTDKNIASVNQTTGMIKARGTGTCEVYFQFADGERLSASVQVIKKKRNLLFFAHRGDTDAYPENSVVSFKSAMAKGCNGVEFDVWYTDSGDLLVFHDETLSDLCKSPLRIQDVSKKNRVRYPIRQTWYGLTHKVLIPTFGEALKAVKASGGICLVHLKYDKLFDPKGLHKLVRLIRKYHMEQSCVIFCSSHKNLEMLKSSGLTLGYISHSLATKRSMSQIDWCAKNRISWFFFADPDNINEKIMEYAHDNQMTVGMYKTRSISDMEMLYRLNADFAMLYYCSLLQYK